MKQSAVLASLDPGLRRDDGTNLITNQLEHIVPVGVFLFNHAQLPSALPFLHLLLAGDGRFDGIVSFKPYQHFAAIFFREAVNPSFAVFPDAFRQVAGHTNVNRSIFAARHNVDEAGFLHRSTPSVIPA